VEWSWYAHCPIPMIVHGMATKGKGAYDYDLIHALVFSPSLCCLISRRAEEKAYGASLVLKLKIEIFIDTFLPKLF